jgi:hypothetical protein
MANSLHEMLPDAAKIENPTMAFATYRCAGDMNILKFDIIRYAANCRDGWSMENLLAKTRDKAPLLILIRTLKHR